MPQSLSQVLIHLIFSTKNRQPFISAEIEPELYAYIAKILYDECHCFVIIIGGDKDHIHILYAQSRIWSIAKVVELIKKRSSKWIKTKGAEFSIFQWQTGYGAFSVSRSGCDNVKNIFPIKKNIIAIIYSRTNFALFLKNTKLNMMKNMFGIRILPRPFRA